MSHTPPNNHHTNNPIDFPDESEEIRFLKAEIQHASLEILSREHFAVFGCNCPRCRDVRAYNGPECGSLAWRAQR